MRLPPLLSTLKTKRRATTPQRGTALPRSGVFHVNPHVRSSVVNQMDSQQEVSTSWDTRVYPSAPILLIWYNLGISVILGQIKWYRVL